MIFNSIYTYAFLILGLYIVQQDPNYMSCPERLEFLTVQARKRGERPPTRISTFEATVIKLIATQGSYHIAIIVNFEGTFKQRFYNNVLMMLSFIIYALFILYMLYCPDFNFWREVHALIMEIFGLVPLSQEIRWEIILLLLS